MNANFSKMLEINEEIKKLKVLGLNDEEIQGYIEFFLENWDINEVNDETKH